MKKTNLLLTVLTFLFLNNVAFGQKAKVTKDEFTGEQIVTAANAFVAYEIKNKVITLVIPFTYWAQLTNVIPEGTEVMLKMDGGEIIKLMTKGEAKPMTSVYASQYSAGVKTQYNYTFELEKITLDKLSKVKMVLARFPNFPSGNVDIEGKMGKKLGKSILTGAKNIIIYS